MSRQSLGLGQAWVVTRVSLCSDRVFLRVGHSYRDRRFCVATGFSKGGVATGCFSVATHRAGLRVRRGDGRVHDRPGHVHERTHISGDAAQETEPPTRTTHATMRTMHA